MAPTTTASVGGTVRGSSVMMSQQPKHFFYARSFALAMFLMGRGHRAVRCEIARDASGTTLFTFLHSDVADDLDAYHAAKSELEGLASEARRF